MLPLLALFAATASASEGYLRQPDVSGDQLVFSAEGDLWLASARGGAAKRLTAYQGDERSAHFSPDGTQIAFTGEYDGNMDVFVVPTTGGEPRRLTFFGSPDDAVGWTPDGKSVIFRSNRTDPNHVMRLYTVPVTGGDATEIPIGWASRLDIDPKTGRYAFTRIGREAATWKRYRGGSADDVWVGDPAKQDYAKVTDFTGPDSYPMWAPDGRIVFLSDLGGTANLWSMKADGTDRKRLTNLTGGFDARWPASDEAGHVAFMLAGDIHLYDPNTGTESKVAIELPGEQVLTRTRYTDAASNLTWFALAPDADRVLLTARGEVFSVPAELGVTLSVTGMTGARESYASYSHDGKRVCYVTDATGEESIVTADAWGRGKVTTVVQPGAKGWLFPPIWAPDGKRLAYADETQTLFVVQADGGAPPKAIDHAVQAEIREYAWSPDGRYLAYSKVDARSFQNLFVWDSVDGTIRTVGGTNVDNHSPAWDPDGRYLYFLSSRWTNPFIGARDMDEVLRPSERPYAVLLQKTTPNPFAENKGLPPAPENPAPQAVAEKAKKEKVKKDKKKEDLMLEPTEEKLTPVVIDWTGLDDRIVAFPVDPGPMGGLMASSSKVFFLTWGESGMNEPWNVTGASLQAFDLESKEVSYIMGDVASYDLAPKANKLAVLQSGNVYVFDGSGAPGDTAKARIRIEDAIVELDPREEWKQAFDEAWRQERDFFWDAGMSGLDWKAIHDQYAALLPRLATRGDLNDLIGEMIGELGTSHTYVGGGDRGVWVPSMWNGTLGADLVREGSAYKIGHIFHGDAADNVDAPLLEPGAGIAEGDYILAVDHVPVRGDVPIDAMLLGRADKRVLLTVNSKPSMDGARDVAITPIGDDGMLRYVDWVRKNREYVASKTDGKVGYLHIPDMGGNGLTRFETWLYPQSDKDALVVDVRWNRGGFVSQLILDKLRRPILGFDIPRQGGFDPYPYARRRGPFVVITNGFAGSDGDIFPRAVQLEGLAPVIGERSWGGVIGIRGDKPLVDGGFISQPEYAFWFREGGWSVENQGVVPDLVVAWDPGDVAKGLDPQLDAAIAEALKRKAATPPLLPPTDKLNDKSRGAYEKKEK